MNSKKVAEDSIKLAHNYEGYYTDRAKEQIHAGADSLVWHQSVDSSTTFYIQQRNLKERIKAIEFSIDSLSKMQ